jgi:hypothetical protein
MMDHRLGIVVSDGVEGLTRALGVFALLGITPHELLSRLERDRLRIAVCFRADSSRAQLCCARLSVLACVETLSLDCEPSGLVA